VFEFDGGDLHVPSELARNPPDGVSVGLGEDENIFCWDLMIIGPPDTLYEGGFFNAKLDFPSDFPNAPPVMTFKTPIWHPNGKLSWTSVASELSVNLSSLVLLRSVRGRQGLYFHSAPARRGPLQ
jgi:ubiquitin-protein ligase